MSTRGSSSAEFVHLHVHSQYSLLESTVRMEELAAAVRRKGMHACALTDRNMLAGAIEFYRACGRHAVKPILGCHLAIAPDTAAGRADRGIGPRPVPGSLTLLATNADGYRNLCRLATAAGTVESPAATAVTWTELDANREGLIALSGGYEGETGRKFLAGDDAGAVAVLRRCRDLFGPDRFFIELMDHGRPDDRRLAAFLRERANADAIPAVATNDVRYVEPTGARAHEVLTCIGQRRLLRDTTRPRMNSDEFYLKSPDEMRHRFAYDPSVIERSLAIAESVALDLAFDRHWLPAFPLPLGSDGEDSFLAQNAEDGLRLRLGDPPPPPYLERIAHELEVIRAKGFAGYFLIVADFIAEARRRGIPVGPGRGSAAGSLVAWALGITEVDPLRYGLIFERFLNPERTALPDIDVDVCQHRREEVLSYVRERYGHDRVAQIITFGTLGARAVLRDVARVHDLGVAETESLVRLIPDGLKMTLAEAREKVPDLANAARGPRAELFASAEALEGLARHASRHAAGIVIANVPITEVCPLYRDADGHVVTQYDMDAVQRLGLLKIDILGLRTLTVLESAARIAGVSDLAATTSGLDDPAVYTMLAAGHALGVFQLDSSGIRELLVRIRPSCFGDLAALIALYRPGPIALAEDFTARKHGTAARTVAHPALEPILADTYGIVLYQEQVMEIAHRVAGFSLAEADELRQAMGKKIIEKMARLRRRFQDGAIRNGVDETTAANLADLIERFAGYGFNKSHAVAYAVIAYRTAWLKCHHPVPFLAALISSEPGDRDKAALYVTEARRMGIEILPPDVNAPAAGFAPAGERAIRVGLAAIRGVGEFAADALAAARADGAFTSLWDLLTRVDTRAVNKRAVEALIVVGAMDALGPNRRSMIQAIPTLWERAAADRRSAESGQLGLFGATDSAVPDVDEIAEFSDLPAREMEHLGFYLGEHPLLQRFPPAALMPAPAEEGETWGVGILRGHEPMTDKRGRVMARLRIETRGGQRELVVFSSLYERVRPFLVADSILAVSGKAEPGGRIVAANLSGVDRVTWEVVLTLPENASADAMHELEILLATARPGACRIALDIPRAGSRYRLRSPHRVTLNHLMEKIAPASLAEIAISPSFPEN